MSATYARLASGDWGIRMQGRAQAGQLVMVTKRSGDSHLETISQVLWKRHGFSLCAIQQHTRAHNPVQSAVEAPPGQQSLDLPCTEQQ